MSSYWNLGSPWYERIRREPRSGEAIFVVAILTPVSDVFLASTNMQSIVDEPQSGEAIFWVLF